MTSRKAGHPRVQGHSWVAQAPGATVRPWTMCCRIGPGGTAMRPTGWSRVDEGECRSRIAGRLVEDGPTGLKVTSSFRPLDHSEGHPVLDAPARIHELALHEDVRIERVGHAVELQQWGVAYGVQNGGGGGHLPIVWLPSVAICRVPAERVRTTRQSSNPQGSHLRLSVHARTGRDSRGA